MSRADSPTFTAMDIIRLMVNLQRGQAESFAALLTDMRHTTAAKTTTTTFTPSMTSTEPDRCALMPNSSLASIITDPESNPATIDVPEPSPPQTAIVKEEIYSQDPSIIDKTTAPPTDTFDDESTATASSVDAEDAELLLSLRVERIEPVKPTSPSAAEHLKLPSFNTTENSMKPSLGPDVKQTVAQHASPVVNAQRTKKRRNHPPYTVLKKLFACEQGEESVDDFVAKCRSHLAKLPEGYLADDVQLDIVFGLLGANFRTNMLRKNITSFNHLLQAGRDLENLWRGGDE